MCDAQSTLCVKVGVGLVSLKRCGRTRRAACPWPRKPGEAEDPGAVPLVLSGVPQGLQEWHRQRSGAEVREARLVPEY